MPARRIHVRGVVQGVGFRPFVYQAATSAHLRGWVANTSAGVEIEIHGDAPSLDAFLRTLERQPPPLARIDDISFEEIAPDTSISAAGFEIRSSLSLEGAFQPISPDISICPDCLRELFDPTDRRYRYPFINCTNCGPRLTIVQDIPYDRPRTTMRAFPMCDECAREYADPLDRRFHAQPVACPKCGPHVWLASSGAQSSNTSVPTVESGALNLERDYAAISQARVLLAQGAIIAVKGLGGFHLACDATNEAAVTELRQRKGRVDKPFALMFSDLETVARHCYVDSAERAQLESRERPIVLLKRRPESNIVPGVAPSLMHTGAMLPYTPLHYLLLAGSSKQQAGSEQPALVMTSGNLSEEPIATDNEEARSRLAGLADYILLHNRDIAVRADDSVVRVYRSELYPIRRSRGYAPLSLALPFNVPPLLATGPELKNTFCVARERYAFLSHHIGDMQNFETLESFEQGVKHFEHIFRIEPRLIAYDLHPDYSATCYALERAEREGLPAVGVQHHHAHIASCMAENGLAEQARVIGVAFDGTGWGDDGTIWGGEFLIAGYNGYDRVCHLANVAMPGGDKAVCEPWRMALAWLQYSGVEWSDDLPPTRSRSAQELSVVSHQIEHRLNAPLTSSMGRLFDAVAALIGVRTVVNYEAQAAIELEALADTEEEGRYGFDLNGDIVDAAPVVQRVVADLRAGESAGKISARFHNGIADMVVRVCTRERGRQGLNQVVLSGGVWQNMTLLERTVAQLEQSGFKVHVHHRVPANDGGVSLGQAIIAARSVKL